MSESTYLEKFDMYLRSDTWDYNICLEQRHYLPLRIEKGSTVLDIGAHIGSFAVLAIQSGAKTVYAFEAVKANYDVLKQNELIHTGIRAFHRAVMSNPKAKSVSINISPLNTGMHSVFRRLGDNSERVLTHDFVKAVIDLEPDFIKCDIEGAEYFLDWTQALNQDKRPKRIVIEYHLDLPTFRSVARPLHDLILGQDYKCYHLPDFTHAHQTLAFYQDNRK